MQEYFQRADGGPVSWELTGVNTSLYVVVSIDIGLLWNYLDAMIKMENAHILNKLNG